MEDADRDHDRARAQMRDLIYGTLERQGFTFPNGQISVPVLESKEQARALHAAAVGASRAISKEGLIRHETSLLNWIANGSEVRPNRVTPRLVPVERNSEEELVFRWARLHWSVPTSKGYGRRVRFLVVDDDNGKLIGLIGLGDPVFALKDRDAWVGWSAGDRSERLHLVMDAFVLGAVPPYNTLLGSKLVALLATSNEVRAVVRTKYEASSSFIRGRTLSGQLAMLTTTSALGRSSVYNRLWFNGDRAFERVGWTKGTGEVAFSDGAYPSMFEYAVRWCTPTARHGSWGTGFRNRREVVKKCLADVGLSTDWVMHGLQREVFVAPLARNARQVLHGDEQTLDPYDRPALDVVRAFRERWLLPRAQRHPEYRNFTREGFRLWPDGEGA